MVDLKISILIAYIKKLSSLCRKKGGLTLGLILLGIVMLSSFMLVIFMILSIIYIQLQDLDNWLMENAKPVQKDLKLDMVEILIIMFFNWTLHTTVELKLEIEAINTLTYLTLQLM